MAGVTLLGDVVEQAYTADLKSADHFDHAGSNPAIATEGA
tara:strand:- start:4106 stop:4225 length:120 start_codon:yes stop_codon:yes gene_type:complete